MFVPAQAARDLGYRAAFGIEETVQRILRAYTARRPFPASPKQVFGGSAQRLMALLSLFT